MLSTYRNADAPFTQVKSGFRILGDVKQYQKVIFFLKVALST